jgi:SAM-dependent methyltransferase
MNREPTARGEAGAGAGGTSAAGTGAAGGAARPGADQRRRRQITRAHYATLGELFNPTTFRHLNALGLGAGWRCWEVGAGGPTVPAWLARRVGPTGYVLATDIDVAALERPAASADAAAVASVDAATALEDAGFEVRRHDVTAESAPAGGFDLVHARLVLMHLADRDAALTAMTGALRPGGWLLAEDADLSLQPLACPDEVGPAERLANKVRRASVGLRGDNLAFGRTLPRLLRSAGLADVRADAYFPLAGPAAAQLQHTMIGRQRERLIAAGQVTEAELDQHLADIADGRLDLATFTVVSAWGRKAP